LFAGISTTRRRKKNKTSSKIELESGERGRSGRFEIKVFLEYLQDEERRNRKE